jgi:hypothetical protein
MAEWCELGLNIVMHTLTNDEYRQSVHDRLSAVQPDDERQWGVMSAAEMVCHVRGAFLAAMGVIESTPITTPIPPMALKAIALWEPAQWKHNFWTIPALKQGAPAVCIGIFEQDLAEALAEMDRFCKPEQLRVDHAFFGAMSYTDWMRWGYLHTDHHLRQFGR